MNPIFGTQNPGVNYVDRPGVYGIFVQDEQIAVIQTPDGAYFLPGGGLEPGETPEQGLAREIWEELGCEVKTKKWIGTATEYSYSKKDETHYCFQNWFYRIEIEPGLTASNADGHTVCWIEYRKAASMLLRQSHAWALEVFCFQPDTDDSR